MVCRAPWSEARVRRLVRTFFREGAANGITATFIPGKRAGFRCPPVHGKRLSGRHRADDRGGTGAADRQLPLRPKLFRYDAQLCGRRSDVGRVGKECVSTCRYRWSRDQEKNKKRRATIL